MKVQGLEVGIAKANVSGIDEARADLGRTVLGIPGHLFDHTPIRATLALTLDAIGVNKAEWLIRCFREIDASACL
jgi:hypothetical protein